MTEQPSPEPLQGAESSALHFCNSPPRSSKRKEPCSTPLKRPLSKKSSPSVGPKRQIQTPKTNRTNTVDLTISPLNREFSLDMNEFNSVDEIVSMNASNYIEQIFYDEEIEPTRIPLSTKSSQAKSRKPTRAKHISQPRKRQARATTKKGKTTKDITDSQAETLELERMASERSYQ